MVLPSSQYVAINLKEHPSLADKVYDLLRNAILDGELAPGQRVNEQVLSEQLGISRSPIREGIRKLQHEGLLILRPRQGAFVPAVDLTDVDAIYAIRAVLEGLVARSAATRLSSAQLADLHGILRAFRDAVDSGQADTMASLLFDFHRTLRDACEARRLRDMISNLRDYSRLYRRLALRIPGLPERVLQRLEGVLEALESRDPAAAEQRMRDHLEAYRVDLVPVIEQLAIGTTAKS